MQMVFSSIVRTGSSQTTPMDYCLAGGRACRWRCCTLAEMLRSEIERSTDGCIAYSSLQLCYMKNICAESAGARWTLIGLRSIDQEVHCFTSSSNRHRVTSGCTGDSGCIPQIPCGATCCGLALAWRAGAALADLEFYAVHPTVLVCQWFVHLISEACAR